MPRLYSVAAAVALASIFAAPALADTALLPSIPVVTGEASVSVAPDLAEARWRRHQRRKDRSRGDRRHQQGDGRGHIGTQSQGRCRDADIRTSRLSLMPQKQRTRPIRRGQATITSYRASNRVSVPRARRGQGRRHHRHADRGRRQRHRRHQLHGIEGVLTLLDDVRPKAIADARRKAEIYAKAAGVGVGEPAQPSAREGVAHAGVSRQDGRAAWPLGAPVAQGEETLSVTVSVSWAIKAAQ